MKKELKKEMYHFGFLAFDKEKLESKEARLNLIAKAAEMWGLYEAGLCSLVQKRISDGKYEYWSVPTKKAMLIK